MTCNTCFKQSVYDGNIATHADYMLFRESGVVDSNDSIYDGVYRGVSIDLSDPFTKSYPKQVKQLVDLGLSVKDKQKSIDTLWGSHGNLTKYVEAFKIDHSNKLVSLGKSVTDKQTQIDSIWTKIGTIPTNGGKGACAWYDIPCHFGNFTSGLGTIALVGIGGLLIYKFVIKRGK